MRRPGELLGRRSGHRPLKQQSGGMRGLAGRMSVIIACILLFTVLIFSSSIRGSRTVVSKIKLDDLWGTAASGGWRPSSTPRSDWPPPPTESSGYLRVRCNGGLNQQRTAENCCIHFHVLGEEPDELKAK